MNLGLCGTPATDEGWEQVWTLIDLLSESSISVYGSSPLSGAFSRRQKAARSPLPIEALYAAKADYLPVISDLLVLWGGRDVLLDRLDLVAEHDPIVLLVGESDVFPAVSEEEAAEGICQLLEGKGALDSRLLLETRLQGNGEFGQKEEKGAWRRHREGTGSRMSPDGSPRPADDLGTTGYVGAGEVLFHRDDRDALLEISLKVNGCRLTTYQADGVLIATPTGSAGHSLSAGGPLVACGTDSLVITPLASHALTARPLLLSGSSVIEARVESRSGSAVLCVDQKTQPVKSGSVIAVRRHSTDLRLACPRLLRPASRESGEDGEKQGRENGKAGLQMLTPVTTSDYIRRHSPFPERNAAREVFSTGRKAPGRVPNRI